MCSLPARVLFSLPPTPSLVLDIQFNRSLAAVLCESREILLYDIATFKLLRRITTASPAMALGARWIAYPGRISHGTTVDDRSRTSFLSACHCGTNDDRACQCSSAGSPDDVANIEALMGDAARYGSAPGLAAAASSSLSSSPSTSSMLLGSSPSYTAIDVAQNVASGLYYLSGIGRATLAPYLSSSPGKPDQASFIQQPHTKNPSATSSSPPFNIAARDHQARRSSHSHSSSPGWVVVQDVVTQQIVCNFECHATALVNLAFDFSGTLLATGSTKGQNLHVYRLASPLHAVVNHFKANTANGKRGGGQQLLYKLQRGITHASIQDISFSQDAKWISVTSAHGTSHLFAIHPEGARISAETHANVAEQASTTVVVSSPTMNGMNGESAESSPDLSASTVFAMPVREVSDFCADFRSPEPKTMTQVLKLRHELKHSSASTTSIATNATEMEANGTPLSIPTRGTLVGSALDASQALLTQLASSTNLSMDLSGYFDESSDAEARRRRRRRRIGCLFTHDGQRLAICCDATLKLYDMRITPARGHPESSPDCRSGVSNGSTGSSRMWSNGDRSTLEVKRSKTSSTAFGFDASIAMVKAWELGLSAHSPSSSSLKREAVATALGNKHKHDDAQFLVDCKVNKKSELRSFAQRSLPLWAHPKVVFRAIDAENPCGRVLEVKRKGPSQSLMFVSNTTSSALTDGVTNDQQLFVLEMDSYFGIGGSPVFDGRPRDGMSSSISVKPSQHSRGNGGSAADIPPLDLQASINLAMSTTLSTTPPQGPVVPPSTQPLSDKSLVTGMSKGGKKNERRRGKGKSKNASSDESKTSDEDDGQSSNASPALQFTIQDMYFAAPEGDRAD